ncbi:Ig-like domain-containing protein [Vogesella sp. GCM10023246]|uniref:Ig-like domain-containing protein n=1 Tax=Vogesella oryzagri TaxID=3160864 RepID=A0ABV1M8T8_9NEIS
MFTRTQATGQKSGQIFQLALLLPLMAAVGGFTPVHAAVPPQAQQALQAAGKVELEGELEVLHVHNADKTSGYRYFLHTDKGRVEMKFKGKGPRQPSGARLKVKGSQSGNVLALDSSTSGSVQVLASPEPNTFGTQNTAVLLVNFQDNQTQPYTKDQANTVVFGEGNSFIKENSSQQTSISGSVFGWITMPIAQTCDYMVIRDAALQAATNAGVNISAYSRHVIVMPKNSTCAWAGLGTVGGSPSTAWMNGNLTRKPFTHEFGHNLGMWHSHSLECGATTLGSSCTRSEYGDWFDTMGAGLAVHYNAFQKERLGWLNYGVSPAIATVESGSATVMIQPYAATGNGTKAVKLLKSVNATTGQKSWYYLEYRQAINLDTPLENSPGITGGVLVHMATEGDGDSSDLLDMTPASNTNLSYEWSDASLAVGKTYTDANGVSMTVLSADGTGAAVSVSTTGQTAPVPSCVRANPTVTLTSSQSGTVTPGGAANYTLSVTNADGSACSSSTFNLASVVPAGWSGSLGAASLTLAAGASGSTTLTVTSSSTATNGSYSISTNASNATQSGYQGAASASFSVQATTTSGGTTTNLAPVAVSDSAATRIGTAVTITVLGNDYDPEGKALAVTAVTTPSKGKVSINSNGTLTYTPNSKAKGGDSFSYTISDGVNKASTSVAVQISTR